jgi:hypothetical protein
VISHGGGSAQGQLIQRPLARLLAGGTLRPAAEPPSRSRIQVPTVATLPRGRALRTSPSRDYMCVRARAGSRGPCGGLLANF